MRGSVILPGAAKESTESGHRLGLQGASEITEIWVRKSCECACDVLVCTLEFSVNQPIGRT